MLKTISQAGVAEIDKTVCLKISHIETPFKFYAGISKLLDF